MAELTPEQALKEAVEKRIRKEKAGVRRAITALTITTSQKAVLQAIVNLWFRHRVEAGTITPTIAELAAKAGYSVRATRSAIREFEARGWMVKAFDHRNGRGVRTAYLVDLCTIEEDAGHTPRKAAEKAAISTPGKAAKNLTHTRKSLSPNRTAVAQVAIAVPNSDDEWVAPPPWWPRGDWVPDFEPACPWRAPSSPPRGEQMGSSVT
ncbi:MAG: hypothetical protein AAFW98_03130 [Pseudomonadota bacterium]